ncbi:MAG: DUF1800 domain-containing protein [Pseudomonadota bacterium]
MSIDAAIAATRFGLGARPGDIREIADAPRERLRAQLGPAGEPKALRGLKSADEAFGPFAEAYGGGRSQDREQRREAISQGLSGYADEVAARTDVAVRTDAPYQERLVRFWSNHFTVAINKPQMTPLVGPFEREAIRPHTTGKFVDMLLAVYRHPAMLFYLDNAQSVGPNSPIGARVGRGLNENLAREALELHTVGVDGGYTQEDVEEFARALTGWSVGSRRLGGRPGTFVYQDRIHEPGRRRVLGRVYRDRGERQAEEILKDLAEHPATARRIARKLATHFIADQPPEDAVRRLERVYRRTDGDLKALAEALIDLDVAWSPDARKVKRPEEFLISVWRGLGGSPPAIRALTASYLNLGQQPFRAPSPEGWPDEADAWIGPDAVKKRLEWAQAVAYRFPRVRPTEFLDTVLGDLARPETRFEVRGADSAAQGLVLAFMSPEFLRR